MNINNVILFHHHISVAQYKSIPFYILLFKDFHNLIFSEKPVCHTFCILNLFQILHTIYCIINCSYIKLFKVQIMCSAQIMLKE